MNTVTTNFGSIGGQRIISFQRRFDEERVVPAKLLRMDPDLITAEDMISGYESFRRWKIARKAWRTRKLGKHQLQLPL